MLNMIFVFFFLSFFGCQKQESVRQFTEIVIPAGPDKPQSSIKWDLPSGWVQEPGDQMRLATFRLGSNPSAFDCSIVSLPGGAGGLEANLKRWMGQINLAVSDEQLNQFIAASNNHVYDFSDLQPGQDVSTESMAAAMITFEDGVVFVKLKAPIASVKKYKADFLKLVKSIHAQ